MAEQHTPGPWHVYPGPAQGFRAEAVKDSGHYSVAQLSGERRDANARLIAAAPAMLAALELYVISDGRGGAIKQRGEAAIAQALGESQ